MSSVNQYIETLQRLATADPERVAVVDWDGRRRTSYAQLLVHASRLADAIRQRSLDAPAYLPVYLPDSVTYLAALLAVWATGHTPIFLGTTLPVERLRFAVEQTGAPFVIDKEFINTLEGSEQTAAPHPLCAVERQDDAPCALFYTSGSTGQPKGILHSDRGFFSYLYQSWGTVRMDDFCSFFTIAPLYFIAVRGIIAALGQGLTVHFLTPDNKKNILFVEAYLAEQGIETAFIPPSMLKAFRSRSQALRLVVTAGERLVLNKKPEFTLLNLYGQTESAGNSILTKAIDRPYENAPVGQPIKGLEVELVDEDGRPVPDGEPGELVVRHLIPPVYFNDPDATRHLMRGGVLHTGDLMKRLPNGDLVFVQRMDWMVKINGQRVEPSEIETVLRTMPGLRDAIVKGFTTDDLTRQYLVAYYIADEEIPAQQIEAFLSERLPLYMVPAFFVPMHAFPLNANGKTDRKSLLPPSESTMKRTYIPPATPLEERLCQAYAKALGVLNVGADDDFFDLGGDSIRVMLLFSELNEASFSKEILYQGRSPRNVAALMEANRDRAELLKELLARRPDKFPLTYGQREMFHFFRQLQDIPDNLYLREAYYFDEHVDPQRLYWAMERVLRHHMVFRSTIEVEQDKPFFVFDPDRALNLSMVEVDNQFDYDNYDLRFFKWQDQGLYRCEIVRYKDCCALFINIIHIISDGTSMQIFHQQLERAYHDLPLIEEAFPTLLSGLAEQELRQTARCRELAPRFDAFCASIPKMPVLSRVARITEAELWDGRQLMARSFEANLDLEAKQAIDDFALRHDVSRNILFMAAYQYTLSRFLGSDDVNIVFTDRHRNLPGTNTSIGMFIKSFGTHVKVSRSASVKEFLDHSRDRFLEALSFEDFPFEPHYLEKGFACEFIYQSEIFLNTDLTLDGKAYPSHLLKRYLFDAGLSLLEFYVVPKEDGYKLSLSINMNLYTPDIADTFLRLYLDTIKAMIRRETVAELPDWPDEGTSGSGRLENAIPRNDARKSDTPASGVSAASE